MYWVFSTKVKNKNSPSTRKRVNLTMYSVVIKTTNSEIEFGTQISSTKRLHEFLCSMDFQLVTKLEVKYFRELKSPHDLTTMSDTGALSVVNDSTLISNGPDSWTIETPQAKFRRHLIKR